MKKYDILVPTDLSEYGNKAFHTAEKIRRAFNGTITPMHTFKEVIWPDGISMPNINEVLSDEIKNRVASKLKSLASKFTDESCINPSVITYGDPFNRIMSEAKTRDLVVMTTHGRKGFKKALLGSVAEKMIRNSPVPVLVTRGRELKSEAQEFTKILVTTDFSEASYKAMPLAAETLRNSDAIAGLLHIVSLEHTGTMKEGEKIAHKAKQKIEQVKKEHFGEFGDRVTTMTEVSTNSPQVAINKILNAGGYDLLILSTLGKSAMKYMLIGSNAASLARSANAPVLVVNSQ
jgi:nucleotide-binding universal stress UspA family protein